MKNTDPAGIIPFAEDIMTTILIYVKLKRYVFVIVDSSLRLKLNIKVNVNGLIDFALAFD